MSTDDVFSLCLIPFGLTKCEKVPFALINLHLIEDVSVNFRSKVRRISQSDVHCRLLALGVQWRI